jgi:vacuolar-type H+-ATPase subunit D/Vma8
MVNVSHDHSVLAAMRASTSPVTDRIESLIRVVRGQKVMLDADLAKLYGVTTKRFNEQVRRNRQRFPVDFMFQLTNHEFAILRSQFATSSSGSRGTGWGGHRYMPFAFTEHGAIMAATILNTTQATEVSVFVVRAFVRLKELVAANTVLSRKLDELERRVSHHDETITSIVKAIRELATPPEPKPKRRIGFVSDC